MADTFRSYIVTFVLIGIFFISMVYFSIYFALDNHTNVTILDNSGINRNYFNVSDSLSENLGTSRSQLNATIRDEVTVNADSLTISSIWGSLVKFQGIIVAMSNLTLNLLNQLGVGGIILGGIITIIIVITILLMWKTIRTGD